MTDKRQKATKVRCKHDEYLTKQSISERNIYSFFLEEAFSNLLELVRRWTINFINIDLLHQYWISLAEAQTSLWRNALAARSEKKRLYS